MTQLPPPQRPDRPAYQLDYAPSDPQRPAGDVPYGWQVALGVVAFVATGLVGVVLRAAIQGGFGATLGVLFLVFCTLVGLTDVARERWRWKGFLIGVLVGLGLLALAIGVCLLAFI
ncbi:MAG: hypothetical protein ACHRHE_12525 [Tepidisphaerales bacterium]